ncbi:MAG: polysaccharide deacetylase family protein [bacterium]
MPAPLVSLTVDLDPVGAYHAIHGLPPPAPRDRHHFSLVAIPRFLELFDQLGVRATFFAVGEDLAHDDVAALLRSAVDAGHEVANHTATHPYAFLDLDPVAQAEEIDRCHEQITAATGRPPVGFRTPGYHIDAPALALLAARGYRYDSSMFPSAPYYAAKAAVMTWMRLRGRRSRSRAHPPTALLAPGEPYHPNPNRPWLRGNSPVLEIPAATRAAGLPLVGTFLAGLPTSVCSRLGRHLVHRPFVTIEFHAIDLLDRTDGGLDPLLSVQPAASTPLSTRRAALDALLQPLCRAGQGMSLAEFSARV